MKKVIFKLTALVLTTAMLMSIGVGCSKKGDSQVSSDNSSALSSSITSSSTTASSDTGSGFKLPIVDKPITIRFLSYSSATANYSMDMPVFKELARRTGISFEWELLPQQNPGEKFNLIMSSGQLPDLISYSEDQAAILKYATQGAFIPLEDKIEQYAPNIKAALDNPPFPIDNIRSELTAGDGHMYTIPYLTPIDVGEIFFIRQDWLTKLNLSIPKTTDELYTVLKAFKEKDPNGNNKQDEIPFVPDSKQRDITLLGNAFGAHESFYVAKDNTIKYGPIDDKDRYIESLQFANKLYNEGLMDPEYLSLTLDQFRSKMTTGIGGLMCAWTMSGMGYANGILTKTDPNAKFTTMLAPKGPHGDQMKERPQAKIFYRTMLSKDNKNVEATMKLLDYLYTEEGLLLTNWGIENETYTIVNGKPQFTDLVLNNADKKDPATVRGEYGIQGPLPTIASWDCELAATPDADVKDSWNKYKDAGIIQSIFPNLPLTEDESSKKASITTQLNTYCEENINKFIMGKESLSNYDKFISGLKNIGIDELLKIYNESFKRYLEFAKK